MGNKLHQLTNPNYDIFDEVTPPTRKNKKKEKVVKNFALKEIRPKTYNQQRVFDYYNNENNIVLNGIAGCGKSFLSLYLALNTIMSKSGYNNITIIRSVLPTRDMGFLPGSIKEKAKIYEAPYEAICCELFERGDAYELLKGKGVIEFITSSFLRGITIRNSIVIVDEIQNMTSGELNTIATRIGENCKVLFIGDFRQTDMVNKREKSGFHDFIKILANMKDIKHVEFTDKDIVRSGFVRDYIISRNQLEDCGAITPFL